MTTCHIWWEKWS